MQLRKEFIQELLNELAKENCDNILINTIIAFEEDILRYLKYNETKEYKINQCILGMKELFRGYISKV